MSSINLSTYEIERRFYTLINVTSITSLIDGEIFQGEKPIDREKQDITVNVLVNTNSRRVKNGIININAYCKASQNGMKNSLKMKQIVEAITNLLDNEKGQNMYFFVENQNDFRDSVNSKMYYSNIRVRFNITF